MASGKSTGLVRARGFVFGCTVDCGSEIVSAGGYNTPKEAKQVAISAAMKRGWEPPRWWQIWRRGSVRMSSLPRL